MCKASYSRKKRDDEIVTARQVEVNAQVESYIRGLQRMKGSWKGKVDNGESLFEG